MGGVGGCTRERVVGFGYQWHFLSPPGALVRVGYAEGGGLDDFSE